jgi:hypothetical protein
MLEHRIAQLLDVRRAVRFDKAHQGGEALYGLALLVGGESIKHGAAKGLVA